MKVTTSKSNRAESPTREQWLNDAVELCRPFFEEVGLTFAAVKVSCGWPSKAALSRKRRRIGECWPAEAAKDKVTQVFISPFLDEVPVVLETLVHELVHAAVGCEHGHKGPFKAAMKKVGLEGKPTATHAGPELLARIASWDVGAYPNGALDLDKVKQKKQGTRLIKCECPECGYTVRTTRKWLEVGEPMCPKHGAMKAEEPDETVEDSDDEGGDE